MRRITTALWISAALAVGACAPASNPGSGDAITQATHIRFFPINDGTNHALNRAALDSCYSCHPTGARQAFDHMGVTSGCVSCHDDGTLFAAMPSPRSDTL